MEILFLLPPKLVNFFLLKPPRVFLMRSFGGIFCFGELCFVSFFWAVCFLSSNKPNCLVLRQL